METVPRRGYRFVGQVDRPDRPPVVKRAWWVAASLGLLLLLAASAYFATSPPSTGREEATEPSRATGEQPSIAVLPLENVGGVESNEYFSDGITDDIISHLSKIGGLRVISRNSSMRYKNSEKSLQEIAKELGVKTFLEGSVRQSGDRVRIVVQLVEAASDQNLWSETYNRESTRILDIQSDVSQQIARALRAELSPFEVAQVEKRGAENSEAYELYLLGQYHLGRYTETGWNQAVQEFQRALELDPGYALVYAALAECYSKLGDRGKSTEALSSALEIDEDIAEVQVRLAQRMLSEWDWAGAKTALERALQLNPNLTEAHNQYASYLYLTGRTAEALEVLKRAQDNDPLALTIRGHTGWALIYDRRFDEAVEHCQTLAELEPEFSEGWRCLGRAYLAKEMWDEAISTLHKAAIVGDTPDEWEDMWIGYGYARMGKKEEALKILEKSKSRTRDLWKVTAERAFVYLGLGENDKALEQMELAYERRDLWLPFVGIAFTADSVRSDPRFKLLMRKMGLED